MNAPDERLILEIRTAYPLLAHQTGTEKIDERRPCNLREVSVISSEQQTCTAFPQDHGSDIEQLIYKKEYSYESK